MKSQVTTGQGDGGETTALSGDRYSKTHPVMACVGTVDELRAHTALLRLQILEEQPRDAEALAGFLFWLLHTYFLVGSACSDPLDKKLEYHQRPLRPEDLDKLEAEQQRLEDEAPLPQAFVVSASNVLAAQADVTCTVARRLERDFARLRESVAGWDAGVLGAFLNRLSDYFYVLARYLDAGQYQSVDYERLGD